MPTTIRIPAALAAHAPLHDQTYYATKEDADDGAGISGTLGHYLGGKDRGYIHRPSAGSLHLNNIAASADILDNRYGNASYGPGYEGVVMDPRFPAAVAALDHMFKLDQTAYKEALNNPQLGGRGDERKLDPAERVGDFLFRTAGRDQSNGNYFNALNPWGVQNPIEYLYAAGFWQRPTDPSDPYSRPQYATQQPGLTDRRGFDDPTFQEWFGHYQNSLQQNPAGHTFYDQGKSLLNEQERYRSFDYGSGQPSGTFNPPAMPPGYNGGGGHWWQDGQGNRMDGMSGIPPAGMPPTARGASPAAGRPPAPGYPSSAAPAGPSASGMPGDTSAPPGYPPIPEEPHDGWTPLGQGVWQGPDGGYYDDSGAPLGFGGADGDVPVKGGDRSGRTSRQVAGFGDEGDIEDPDPGDLWEPVDGYPGVWRNIGDGLFYGEDGSLIGDGPDGWGTGDYGGDYGGNDAGSVIGEIGNVARTAVDGLMGGSSGRNGGQVGDSSLEWQDRYLRYLMQRFDQLELPASVAQILATQAAAQLARDGLNFNIRQFEQVTIPQMLHSQGMDRARFQWERDSGTAALSGRMPDGSPTLAGRMADQNFGLSQAGVTGSYNGAPTFQARQADIRNRFDEAGVTGSYNGAPTFAARQADIQNRQNDAALTGKYNGADTLAATQFNRNFGLNEAGLTGTYNGAPTLAAKAQEQNFGLNQAGLTGYYNGSPTLARTQFDEGTRQNRVNTALDERTRLGGLALNQTQFAANLGLQERQQMGALGLGRANLAVDERTRLGGLELDRAKQQASLDANARSWVEAAGFKDATRNDNPFGGLDFRSTSFQPGQGEYERMDLNRQDYQPGRSKLPTQDFSSLQFQTDAEGKPLTPFQQAGAARFGINGATMGNRPLTPFQQAGMARWRRRRAA